MSEWNGVPQNPEREGWHWVTDAEMPCRPWCEYWNGRGSWAPLGGTPDAVRRMWRYLGPCLTPDEAQAREAAAYKAGQEDMRERAAQDVECGCDNAWKVVCHHPSSAARWNLCGRNPCGAISAMGIRELPIKEINND